MTAATDVLAKHGATISDQELADELSQSLEDAVATAPLTESEIDAWLRTLVATQPTSSPTWTRLEPIAGRQSPRRALPRGSAGPVDSRGHRRHARHDPDDLAGHRRAVVPSTATGQTMIALYEPAGAALPAVPAFSRPLNNPYVWELVSDAAAKVGHNTRRQVVIALSPLPPEGELSSVTQSPWEQPS